MVEILGCDALCGFTEAERKSVPVWAAERAYSLAVGTSLSGIMYPDEPMPESIVLPLWDPVL